MKGRTLLLTLGLAIFLCMACIVVQASEDDYERVTVKEVMEGNSTFMGRAVELEGTIAKECPSRGCWLVLDDGTGSILVDLKPNNFTMPLNMTGKAARVLGNVTAVGEKRKLTFDPGTPYVIGKRVEISGEFDGPLVSTG